MFGIRFIISLIVAIVLQNAYSNSQPANIADGFRRYQALTVSSPSYRPVYVGGGIYDVYEKPVSHDEEATTAQADVN
ncbi:unnamed protein product [Bursaphelenchus okinawaensis]|uniref:Uncharacterized protein n=1 Tax=Bursaphelenchus okinawaensis TaxID=465554 RepID=A0A811LAS2_9BILA|nr:unnamed protein product [Bursaphelenchus okinawaensis]CAG9122194.1 unnamed protein product [Bursaphelenchus okinawaensis]